jgi:hypothetical protein
MIFGATRWPEWWIRIPLAGMGICPHFSLLCLPVCVVLLRLADPPTRGHTTCFMDTLFRN